MYTIHIHNIFFHHVIKIYRYIFLRQIKLKLSFHSRLKIRTQVFLKFTSLKFAQIKYKIGRGSDNFIGVICSQNKYNMSTFYEGLTKFHKNTIYGKVKIHVKYFQFSHQIVYIAIFFFATLCIYYRIFLNLIYNIAKWCAVPWFYKNEKWKRKTDVLYA